MPGVSGTWKALTDSVNAMANSLTVQVRNIADVATAVTKGDLTRQITVDAQGELDHRLDVALEQDGQHDDVARRRFAEARRDLDVVIGDVLQQDRLLLEHRLADQPLARCEAICNVLSRAIRVTRDELERRAAGILIGDEERTVMS